MDMDIILDKIQADSSGLDLEVYRVNKALRLKILEKSHQYFETPCSKWPAIYFNWDLSKEGQRFSLDGEKEADFKISYPEGFLLGTVALSSFDKKLCYFSRRNEGELWSVGSKNDLAYLIVYLSEKRPISPPLVKPHMMGEVMLQGGHHRYTIAKEIGEIYIPIYVEPHHKKEIDNLIDVNWCNLSGES